MVGRMLGEGVAVCGKGKIHVLLPREVLLGNIGGTAAQHRHDATCQIRRIRRLDVDDVPVDDLGERSRAGDDEVLSEGAGFSGGKTETFHQRRDDDRIHGGNVVAELRVFDARNPDDAVGNARFRDLRLNEIGTIPLVSGNDQHGLEIGDFRNDFGNGVHDELEPLGNPRTTEVQSGRTIGDSKLFSDCRDAGRIDLRSVPKIGIHSVVYGGEFGVGQPEKQTEAILGVMGNAKVFREREGENGAFEKLEKETLGAHEAVPKLSEHLVHGKHYRSARNDSENARGNRRSVRGRMYDVGFLREAVSYERDAEHQRETVSTGAVHLYPLAHFLVRGNFRVMPARKHRHLVTARGEAFDDVFKKGFRPTDMRNVIIENEEDFHGLFEEFVPNHLERDIEGVRRFLPLSEGVFVVEDVNGNFFEFQAESAHLVDELAGVFHSVHSEAGALYGRHAHHAVSVMRIREAYAGDKAGEDASAHEDDLAEEGHVRIGLHDEARTENDVERRIFGESSHEVGHVGGVVLSVGVERGNERDVETAGETAEKLETGFECGSPTAVLGMSDGHHVFPAGEDGGGSVAGTVVDDEDLRKPRCQKAVDHAFEAGGLVIGAYEERHVLLGGFRTVVGRVRAFIGKSEHGGLRRAHVERHFPDEPSGVFAVLFRLIEEEQRKIRKEDDAAVYENVRAAGNAEDASDEVERLGDVREEQESAADSEEYEEMEGVEFLPLRNVERDNEDHDPGDREKRLEKIHGRKWMVLRFLYPVKYTRR